MNIKFTKTLPTVPGVYWSMTYDNKDQRVVSVTQDVRPDKLRFTLACGRSQFTENANLKWSERLVPVSCVEDAYSEGVSDGFRGKSGYDSSTARKTVEGTL